MKTNVLTLILVLVLCSILAGAVLANNEIEWPRWVLGGGASDSTTSDVTLRATLGQPLVGLVSGGDVTLGQGFWHGGSLPESGRIYLPFIQR